MLSQGSILSSGKTREEECCKHDQKEDDVCTTAESGEKSTLSLHEEESAMKGRTEDKVLRSPSLSETHAAATASTEEREAAWVDDNRHVLIQSVTSVMQIADKMLKNKIIQDEQYANIKAARTAQERMREIYGALTSRRAKCAFYRILQEVHPDICETEDSIKEIIEEHKENLREKFTYEFGGTNKDHEDAKSLDEIYTELHIIQGESDRVNREHEIWEIADKARSQTSEGRQINCNDIFKNPLENSTSSGQDRKKVKMRAIRTVMTKGIAGIGKTVSVKKFILDWADGKANQGFNLIFVLPFRELNLVTSDQFSLETLVKDFHPELKNISGPRLFANKVLFIFDGLDESQLALKITERLTDPTQKSSVDVLVTNLIQERLLPSAFVWITSRPGAVQRIPRQHIHQWTEVRGFNDPQKIQYFRKAAKDEAVAERIIDSITSSRSLHIMCHIPIFCWIVVQVFDDLLKRHNGRDDKIKIPTTLTEMYTHFLCTQMQVSTDKYDRENEFDTEEIFMANKEFILKLGRMAFEHLKESNIIFTGNDLKHYGIDIHKAGICSGLCTQIFKKERVVNTRKLYCFVHLTVQEYFAALFVYHSFASKTIASLSLKDFLLIGSEEELKAILDADPVDLPLNELMEIAIANSTSRKTGELDMFLRFLMGMSLQSTQDLLQGLIQQTEEHSVVVEEVKESLREIDLLDCSSERCLNLVHCLIELKDSSLHDTVQQYLRTNHSPETQLTPVQCSALADSVLMSNTPLDEFELKKYRPSTKGVFRLVPAVRNSRKAIISGVDLDVWLCETISSALRMPNSVLTELHLIDCYCHVKGSGILIDGLMSSQCKLKALSLSGVGFSSDKEFELASAIKSLMSDLRALELSGNILGGSLCLVLSGGLGSLETLRLNRNSLGAETCQNLVIAFTSDLCYLRELELSYTNLSDSEMEVLCTVLTSTCCNLEVLSFSHNRLTGKACDVLASALSSKTSSLADLDLSYNDLQDSGVMALCNALMDPHCALKTLRLSFCKVTGDGCAALASALRSDPCSLRELDLSFNHLTDQGVETLTEIQKDSRCSLEELNVAHNEECWFDLTRLWQYACDLTLDLNTAGLDLVLTEENKKATYVEEKQSYPDNPERFDYFQVLCEEGLTGRHYWEVECVKAHVGVAYRTIDRVGDSTSDYSLGGNEKSWCWNYDGSFQHNNSHMEFMKDTRDSTIGVYLDWPAGILSFFEVFPTPTHLYTVRTTFTEPLYPGFTVEESIHICSDHKSL